MIGSSRLRVSNANGIGRVLRVSQRMMLIVLAAIGSTPARAQDSLLYIFQLSGQSAQSEADASGPRFICSLSDKPLTDMSNFKPFYKPDSTQSVVDPAAMAAFVKKAGSASAAVAKNLEMMRTAITSQRDRKSASLCIMRELRRWADKNALLGNIEKNDPLDHRQAVMVAAWTSVAFANAYAVALQTGVQRGGMADTVVKAWFSRIVDQVIAEYAPPTTARPKKYRWLDDMSNHRYWAAATVGLLSVHLQDRSKFDWSMDILKRALAQAPEDGGLPRELARGGKSLHYQNFAMQSLALLVALADANNVELTDEEERKFAAVARFSANMFVDPEKLQARTGYLQEKKQDMIAWIDVAIPHFRRKADPLAAELDRVAAPYRPMTDTFIALPSTQLFAQF